MSWMRFLAILIKELRQVRRDRLTFGMMVAVPIVQLILFGFAINGDPKHLPLAVVVLDQSEFSRSFVAGLENSDYFRVTDRPASVQQADELLARGQVQFALVVPSDFSRKLQRGEQPAMLLAADATVTVAHSRTRDLAAECRRADILVAAIGKPQMVQGDWIQPGATVIDVGINRLPDGKLVGDVDFPACAAIAGAITPVPGGVGPMTVACLLENTLTAALRRRGA